MNQYSPNSFPKDGSHNEQLIFIKIVEKEILQLHEKILLGHIKKQLCHTSIIWV